MTAHPPVIVRYSYLGRFDRASKERCMASEVGFHVIDLHFTEIFLRHSR